MAQTLVTEPFPISRIANRYLIFDVNIISHIRREHNICGVLIGTIPNLSQQNVFLGIPMQLMPEETRLLVEHGHAYIVEDADAHKTGFMEMSREDRLAFLRQMDKQGVEMALDAKRRAADKQEKVLKEKGLERKIQEKNLRRTDITPNPATGETSVGPSDEKSLSDSMPPSPTVGSARGQKVAPYFITPTTSHPPLPTPPLSPAAELPKVPHTYPLFRHLQSKGYFSTPGLRFGCHYTAYPGDPLRFHSHFLATGLDWDEEFELLDIVGGGRLGTGVKKAYLIGGEDPEAKASGKEDGSDPVRAFSIEWAGL
ncbi:SEN34 subunit of tRNA-splicing endonuclease [Zopfia rhizophila CBS 207.26]|uniref:tRNA-splicing endonuclease subunit Sen34 n=1 Tax=Zopfia rhizophila CBS 207.26 TaxID=1314779 RepID=A0A6A6EBA3_9PEZI|nr:SEN34 subunit of tRNA-splicing endonuclease [Zopfia rhizophila CBS 207.26]